MTKTEAWENPSKELLKKLYNRDKLLSYLERAGVEDWDGYAAACEQYEEQLGLFVWDISRRDGPDKLS